MRNNERRCHIVTIIYYLVCIAALNVLIFIHEMFHLGAAKLLRIKASEFAVGFGPTLVAYQKKDGKRRLHWFPSKTKQTVDTYTMSYHLKIIPLGGYVLFGRMDKKGDQTILEDYLYIHKPWKRMIVAAAGPFGNLVCAVALAMILLMTNIPMTPNEVASVAPDSVAQELSIQKGDRLIAVNGAPVQHAKALREAMANQQEVCVTWERVGKTKEGCTTISHPAPDQKLGVSLGLAFIPMMGASVELVTSLTSDYLHAFWTMITHVEVEHLSGPVGVVDVMHDSLETFSYFLMVLIAVNIGLAVANLILPFTITDGGRIVLDFLAILFRKHRIPSKYLDVASLCLMLCLFLFTLYLDISRLL